MSIQSINQNTKISGDLLPVRACRKILKFLPPEDQGAYSQASKRLYVIAKYDPSADLEKMKHRKAVVVPPHKGISTDTPGPSSKFLFSDPGTQEERYKIGLVHLKMTNNQNVQKTVLDVIKLESHYSSQYISLVHAMNVPTFAFSLFTRTLLSTPYLPSEPFPCSIPIVRFPSPDGPKTIKELFEKNPLPKDKTVPYDKIPEVQRELLSLNPHLFANFMQDGESSWYFYTGNNSVAPPPIDALLKMLCKQYKLPTNEKDLKKLEKIHGQLSGLALSYARLSLEPEKRDTEDPTGMLLQLFVPPSVLDQVGYASLPYGKPDTRSQDPLSTRCLSLKQNPRSQPQMQVRLLIQSMFVPDHRITVIPHGCGDFFSASDPQRLSGVSSKDWEKQQIILTKKHKLLQKARNTFLHMIIHSVSKK